MTCHENTMSLHQLRDSCENITTLWLSERKFSSSEKVTAGALIIADFIWNTRCLEWLCTSYTFYSWGLTEAYYSCLLRPVPFETSNWGAGRSFLAFHYANWANHYHSAFAGLTIIPDQLQQGKMLLAFVKSKSSFRLKAIIKCWIPKANKAFSLTP